MYILGSPPSFFFFAQKLAYLVTYQKVRYKYESQALPQRLPAGLGILNPTQNADYVTSNGDKTFATQLLTSELKPTAPMYYDSQGPEFKLPKRSSGRKNPFKALLVATPSLGGAAD